ncbi:cobyrinate a,c-diamide synthase [Novosphingobium sp. M1R2S20]|uniref:Cobyrinate a,c-diamide synthase n=1 Tax=Novosphingobium rhizovicinum TaxID=3228928 RepID=A0ABV3RE31_9SPHN
MSTTGSCPALMVAAPSSGQGKTLVTAALARRHRDAGRRVRVFKCGPDYLDPMVLERACGSPVHQLDLFMVGEAACRRLLHDAALDADLILVEGVMGLFDGTPSAADLANRFDLPVLAVIDGSAMAQTFGALVQGLATYRRGVNLAAVLANKVGSARHAAMLEESVPSGVQWLGAMPRNADIALPERHLGLMQAQEIGDLEDRLAKSAASLPDAATWLPPPVHFGGSDGPSTRLPALLRGTRVAIARDEAFGFIYPANLACLRSLGAELRFFSPLNDPALPECDAIWFPGGYPELHLAALSQNKRMISSVRDHHSADRPILAECGGMLYCLEEVVDSGGRRAELAGLLPGSATMRPRLTALGLQQADLPGGSIRGHTFHYSDASIELAPSWFATRPGGEQGEAIYRSGRLTATYAHFYFASGPQAVAEILGPG